MSHWKILKIEYLSEGSSLSDNMGQIPIKAKYKKTFLNTETGELSSTTDLQSKIYKRNNYLKLFLNVYEKYFAQKRITILTCVVYIYKYPTITSFINMLSRKLVRKGIQRLGYVWVRDVGDVQFEKHYHVLIATQRIDGKQFHELFKNKKHNDYKVEFKKTPNGMKDYLSKKDLFGEKKQRSFGKSRRFPLDNHQNHLKKQIKTHEYN
jgi:hypothetical protein